MGAGKGGKILDEKSNNSDFHKINILLLIFTRSQELFGEYIPI